jgi:hypothetical protein
MAMCEIAHVWQKLPIRRIPLVGSDGRRLPLPPESRQRREDPEPVTTVGACTAAGYSCRMTAAVHAPKTEPETDPFAGRVQQDLLRVEMADGSTLEGSFLTQAGMAFVHVRDGSVHGRVEGPIDAASVRRVVLLRDRDSIVEERRIRRLGEPVPGNLRRDRDGYEARLEPRRWRRASGAPRSRPSSTSSPTRYRSRRRSATGC